MTTATYGKPETARAALEMWDRGESVFTAEMGGIGPGYEQCIHVIAFEIVRELLKREPLDWYWEKANRSERTADEERECRAFVDDVEAAVMPRVRHLGMSGAQWGAAQNLAYICVRKGWATALGELPDDRLIQVSRTWPKDVPPATDAVDPSITSTGKTSTRDESSSEP